MSTDFQKATKLLNSFQWMVLPNTHLFGITIETAVETITPAIAEKLLLLNTSNRPVKQGNVDRIASAMQNGNFYPNGDCIRIDQDGNIIDGQHRLLAIIKSGLSFAFEFKRGFVRKEAYMSIDGGSRRSLADRLKHFGFKDCNACSSFTKTGVAYKKDSRTLNQRHPNLDDESCINILKHHPDFRHSYHAMKSWASKDTLFGISDRGTHLVHYLLMKHHRASAIKFFDILTNNYVGLAKGHPVYQLRRVYGQMKAEKKQKKGYDSNNFPAVSGALMAKAFFAFQAGKTISDRKFKWVPGVDEFPDCGEFSIPQGVTI